MAMSAPLIDLDLLRQTLRAAAIVTENGAADHTETVAVSLNSEGLEVLASNGATAVARKLQWAQPGAECLGVDLRPSLIWLHPRAIFGLQWGEGLVEVWSGDRGLSVGRQGVPTVAGDPGLVHAWRALMAADPLALDGPLAVDPGQLVIAARWLGGDWANLDAVESIPATWGLPVWRARTADDAAVAVVASVRAAR